MLSIVAYRCRVGCPGYSPERAIPLLPAHKRQRGPWGWSPGYQPAGRGGKPARRPHWPTATACCAQRLVTCLEGASAVRVPALLLPYAGERPNRLWDDVQLWHHGGFLRIR